MWVFGIKSKCPHGISFSFSYRQIVAYKNLIEALEHISIAMILALGFFVNGRLKLTDYSEFIRANSLSQEQLLSAKHFLQRDQLFADGIETELLKWYSEFTTRVTNSYEDGNYFDTRHKFVSGVVNDKGVEKGANYLLFMTQTILPRIVETQQMIKNDIRFI